MSQIINSKEITHQLILQLSRDETKTIYLTSAEATAILNNINSADQFIVIKSIGEAYPKFGAKVLTLSEDKKAWLRNKHKRRAEVQANIQARKLDLEKNEKVNFQIQNWINEHAEEYETMVKKEIDKINKAGIAKALPEKTKMNLASGTVKLQIKDIIKYLTKTRLFSKVIHQ